MRIFCLSLFLSAAALSDLSKRKISNRLVLAGLLCGALLSFHAGGFGMLLDGFLTAAAILAIFWIFFSVRLIGAGDVKLLMATAVFVGSGVIMNSIIPILVFSVITICVLAIRERRLRNLDIPLAVPVALGVLWSVVIPELVPFYISII